MAEKDMTEKTLESYNDVFADIVNVLLFNGRQVVKENELTPETPRSLYKADGKLHEQERDVAKFWNNTNVRIALYGLENQTDIDVDIPLRIISSDFKYVADYFVQVRKNKKYVPSAETIDHVRETLQLMAVLTKDRRFEEYANVQTTEGGSVTMCEVLDKMISEGYNRGISIGEARGISIGEARGRSEAKKEYEKELAGRICFS